MIALPASSPLLMQQALLTWDVVFNTPKAARCAFMHAATALRAIDRVNPLLAILCDTASSKRRVALLLLHVIQLELRATSTLPLRWVLRPPQPPQLGYTRAQLRGAVGPIGGLHPFCLLAGVSRPRAKHPLPQRPLRLRRDRPPPHPRGVRSPRRRLRPLHDHLDNRTGVGARCL